MSLLEVKEAGFGYREELLFDNINFAVNRSEAFCLFGPNGCGKTTLLECILGSLKLKQGKVLLGGKKIEHISHDDIARQIAYLPQGHNQSFPYTVEEVVVMGRSAYIGMFSTPGRNDYEVARQALEMVGMIGLKDRPYTQISGGEVQLVLLARALAQEAPLIIMDEPTCHLDFGNEIVVLETIVQLIHDTGLSIVMATHSPNHAFYLENNGVDTKVALMMQKSLSSPGLPVEVLTEENLLDLYNVRTKLVTSYADDGSLLRQVMPVSRLSNKKER